MRKPDLEQHFESEFPRYLAEWKEFLQFPSISADPRHHQDCLDCAHWLVKQLESLGLEAKLLATSTKPIVFAEHRGRPDRPTVLLYGHYDVQPVDPIEEWETPPFEPTEREGRLYARGAEDNKGQLLYVLKAIETLIQNAALDLTVKIVVEGEEESGGRAIYEAIERWKDMLQADVLMVCDTGTVRSRAPTIVMGLRGIVYLTASLTGATHDLHSGVNGGAAPNAAEGMAALVASLHDGEGRIAIEDYYTDVRDPEQQERARANGVPFDESSYLASTGVAPVAGEPGFTPQERIGFRPTIDINGIHSGYGGEGAKTVIPARAIAKISSRLVPDQDPSVCLRRIKDHLRQHTPPGLALDFPEEGTGGPGFRLNVESPLVDKARAVLDRLSDAPTALLWEGASIPVVAALAEASGAEPLLVGFGWDEDRIHAPNESFSFEQFRQGYLYAGMLLGDDWRLTIGDF